MATVTKRIKEIKQPRGGYVSPKKFSVITKNDGIILNEENINATNIGATVEYLTRFMVGAKKEEAFDIPQRGAFNVKEFFVCQDLMDDIIGLDDDSIDKACKLTGYDIAYRVGKHAYTSISNIKPDKDTIDNIRVMVNRSLEFWKEYGPVRKVGFELKGKDAKYITNGDGDFLTEDTIWDFKVIRSEPSNEHTLQLLVYYIMGKHLNIPEFSKIEKLGLFNPRKNKIYLLNIKDIPEDIVKDVSEYVIGY